MNIAIIPARGGSKRIPRKNIKEFNGKPLIAYSIDAALKSELFNRVVVSTDDNEIADIAMSYKAEVPFIRPEELSDDYTGTIPVIKHAIEWFESQGEIFSQVCCIYATAPFIQSNSLIEAYEQLNITKSDYCFSVTSFAYPIQRAVKVNDSNRLKMFYPKYFNKRSQDLEDSFHDAGQFYWGNSESFVREKALFTEISTPYILPRHLVQDIDTVEDFIRAELMYKLLKQSGEL